MTRTTRILAGTVGLLLIVAPITGSMGGLDTATTTQTTNAAATSTQQTTNTNATVITECQTTIRESGRYVLTENLTNESGTCTIVVQAEDVTIDGNGHYIDGGVTLGRSPLGALIAANVTVKNMTVNRLGAVRGGGDSTFRNVTVRDGSIHLYETGEITFTDSRIINSTVSVFAVRGWAIRNSTLEETTITLRPGGGGLLVSNVTGHNSTIQNASHVDSNPSIVVRDSELEAIKSLGRHSRITNSTLGSLTIGFANNTSIRNSTITGAQTGITVVQANHLTITNSTITNNTIGIHLKLIRNYSTSECVNGTEQRTVHPPHIEIHHNNLANNTVGIQNDDTYRESDTVNATHNYWGASNGPSSPTSDLLEDPETGTLADGDGASVSEHPEQAGVSNVRFDPWLDTTPTNTTA